MDVPGGEAAGGVNPNVPPTREEGRGGTGPADVEEVPSRRVQACFVRRLRFQERFSNFTTLLTHSAPVFVCNLYVHVGGPLEPHWLTARTVVLPFPPPQDLWTARYLTTIP